MSSWLPESHPTLPRLLRNPRPRASNFITVSRTRDSACPSGLSTALTPAPGPGLCVSARPLHPPAGLGTFLGSCSSHCGPLPAAHPVGPPSLSSYFRSLSLLPHSPGRSPLWQAPGGNVPLGTVPGVTLLCWCPSALPVPRPTAPSQDPLISLVFFPARVVGSAHQGQEHSTPGSFSLVSRSSSIKSSGQFQSCLRPTPSRAALAGCRPHAPSLPGLGQGRPVCSPCTLTAPETGQRAPRGSTVALE